jgi:RHS repeat-associated protein
MTGSMDRLFQSCRVAALVAATFVGMTVAPVTFAAVGATAGSFGVSPGGAAQYSIPIFAPAGAGGLKPSISLSYSSRGGDDLAGMGFGIDGLSVISRCNKTLAANGAYGAPTLSTTDQLCLDGNILRLTSGTYGTAGSKYRTEIDTFTRVTAYDSAGGNSANGPAYFVAELKNGLIYEYGNTDDSRIESIAVSGGQVGAPRVWALNRIHDRYGNAIDFSYEEDTNTGAYRPSAITWARNSGISPPYTISFVYEPTPRPDTLYGYRFGNQFDVNGQIIETKRIDRIDVLYNTSTVIRRYDLTYESSGGAGARSRLQSITECGVGGSECFSPTTFSWISGAPSWSAETSTGQVVPVAPLVMDINGDGRDDLVYSSSATSGSGVWTYMLASASGGYGSATSTGYSNLNFSDAQPIEWDGDGRSDLLVPYSGNTWWVFRANGSGFDAPIDTGVSWSSSQGSQWWVADVNGDGLGDLIHIGGGVEVYVRIHTPGGGFGAETLIATISLGTQGSLLKANAFGGPATRMRSSAKHPDFDGDGREDFVIRISGVDEPDPPNPTQTTTYLCEVLPRGTDAASYSCDEQYFGTINQNPPLDWFMGDANGDGLTDLFSITQGVAYVAVSRGTWYGNGGSVNVSAYTASSAVAADWDGDGLDDLIITNSSGGQFVARSSGISLSIPVSTGVTSGSGNFQSVGDLNGDGLPDLMRSNPSGSAWVYSTHQGVQADLLDQATDGFGNFVNFDYVSAVQSNYTKGTSVGVTGPTDATTAYPEQDWIGPRTLVSQYTASNGIGGSYSMSYQYYGGRTNLKGRGFEGFYAVRSVDSRSGLYGYRFFHRDFPFIGMLWEEHLYQPNNSTLIAKRSNTFASSPVDTTQTSQPFFAYLSSSASLANEVNGPANGNTITEISTSYTFDTNGLAYGNPTTITTTTKDRDTTPPVSGEIFTQTTTQHFDYSTADSYWCIGLPDQTTVQSTLPDSTSQTRTRGVIGSGIDYAKCRVLNGYVEPTSSTLATTTTTVPDSTGNITSISVVGKNWDGATLPTRVSGADFGTRRIFPETTTNALNQVTTLTYRYDIGALESQTDPNGLTASFIYDNFARKQQETRPDGTYTRFDIVGCTSGDSYCSTSDSLAKFSVVATAKDSTGTQIRQDQVIYDALGRERYSKTQLPTGAMSTVATTYDALGRVATRTAPYTCCTTYATTYTYDLLNRVIQTSTPVPSIPATQVVGYQYQGRTLSITDPKGTTQKITDVMGRLRRIIDPSPGGTSQYSYDPFGNLISTTDAVGATQSWTYNLLGFKTGASVPVIDAGNWVYRVDSLGELVQVVDAKSQTTTYTYDALSRALTRTELEGTTRWIWDIAAGKGIGQLATVSSPGYGETYVYDSLGRPQTISYAEDRTYQVDFAYNSQGLVDTLTYPVSNANYRLKLKYDYSYGALTATRDANGSTVFWQLNSVDAFGHLIDEQTANGLHVLTSFDPSTGWMGSRQSGTGGSTTNAQNLAHTWDTSGDLSQRQDLNQGLTEVFHYDALHRLSDSTLNGSPNFSVSLDSAGNILSKTGMSSYAYDPTYKRALQTVGGSSYLYDSNGNVTSGGGATINWQSYNLPSQISKSGLTSQFFYGANRQRWKQVATFADGTQTTIYVAGLMEKIRGPAGTGYRYYIPAGSSTVIYTRWCDGTTNTFYVTEDHLGSSSAVTCGSDVSGCANGAIFVQESFDAYGSRRGSGWSGTPTQTELSRFAQTTRHGYTGHEMLDNIGLIHMNGRVYDPSLGRFLSADPLMAGGSQGLNRYSYVYNNPLALTDPSGFESLRDRIKNMDENELVSYHDWMLDVTTQRYNFGMFLAETLGGSGFGSALGGAASSGASGGCWSIACLGNQVLGGFVGVRGSAELESSSAYFDRTDAEAAARQSARDGAGGASESIQHALQRHFQISYEVDPENQPEDYQKPISISSGIGGDAANYLPGAGFAGCLFSMGTAGACGFGRWAMGAADVIPSEMAAILFARIALAARALPRLEISASRYPELAENILHAQQAGHPNILTHGGDAAANRAAALDGVPNIRGLSRDEYPFASSMQGGGGSWVGHIPASQQQAQGGLIADFLRRTGIKAGDQYEVVIVP